MERNKKGVKKVTKKIEKKAETNCNSLNVLLIAMVVLLVLNVIATVFLAIHICEYETDARNTNVEMYRAISALNKEVVENDNSWREILFEKTTLAFDNPEEWNVAHSYVSYCKNNYYFCSGEKYEIVFSGVDEESFNDFASNMYERLKGIDANEIVQGFEIGRGYYEIASFEETINGTMYFDEKPRGTSATPRHKVKLQYDGNNGLAIVQVDIY